MTPAPPPKWTVDQSLDEVFPHDNGTRTIAVVIAQPNPAVLLHLEERDAAGAEPGLNYGVVLGPQAARKYAAAILDAADHAERLHAGRTP